MKGFSISIINHENEGYVIKVNGEVFLTGISKEQVKELTIAEIFKRYENR